MIGADRSQPGEADMPRYQQMEESQLDDAQRRVFICLQGRAARLGAAAGSGLAEES
jgi:hypothetical protein